MPRLRYALQPDHRILEAYFHAKQPGLTLLLNRKPLTHITDAQVLETGANVSLPDGSFLLLRLRGGRLTVLHDNKLLVSPDDWGVRQAFVFGFLLGAVNLAFGVAGVMTDSGADTPATGALALWTNIVNKTAGVVLTDSPIKATLANFMSQPAPMGYAQIAYGVLLLCAGLLWLTTRSNSALLAAFTAVMFASAVTLKRVVIVPDASGLDVVVVLFLMLLLRFVCLVGIVEALRTTSRAGRMTPNVT